MKGIVKNIPIQKPISPSIAIITATIRRPSNMKNCLETIMKLPLIASATLRFPKIIRGITKKVKNEMV